jgi:glycosyltransferase involved in cell wall biosynthesis
MPTSLPALYLDADCFTRPFGGVAKSTWWLYQAFALRYAHVVRVMSLRRSVPYLAPLPPGMQDVPLGNLFFRDAWRAVVIPAFSRMRHVKVMHFPNNGRIPVGFPLGKGAMTLHDVLGLEVEGYLEGAKRERYMQNTQRYIDACPLLMTVSEYSKQQIMRHFSTPRGVHVIPNAPTLPKLPIEHAFELHQTKPYFIYTGRYEARKGIDDAIRAMMALHQQGKTKTQLWLTGKPDYYNEDFKNLVETAKAQGVIQELGYVTDDVLATLMRESRGLVYLSKAEGFGLPPLEAMNQACPVITTRLTAIPEACGDAVRYVNPNDLNDVKDALLQLDEDASFRHRLIEAGYVQAAKFSWETSAALYAKALNDSKLIHMPELLG